jgi:hypothetical protein
MERGADPWWDHLVDVLATIGEVSDRDPHGLTVTLAGDEVSTRMVEVVMTPAEYDDLTGIGGWEMDAAAQSVRQQVLDQPSEQQYLVYSLYNLVPCESPVLPVDPAFARLQELAAKHPDGIPGGGWYAHRPDGSG